MGHPESDLSQITVPTEDEAIPRAFAQLEENISAWSGAISDAHHMLQQLVEQARNQQADAVQAIAKVKEAQASLDSQAAALKAESQASVKQTPEPKPVEKAPAAKSPPVQSKAPEKKAASPGAAKGAKAPPKYTREMAQSETDESNNKRGKSLGGLFVRKKATNDDAADDAAQNESVAWSKADDPDEALLATLDEKTAQAIRIKRRLLNKSVRELLDEMK